MPIRRPLSSTTMTMYKIHVPSSTSLSDDNDDDDLGKSVLFGGSDRHDQSLVVAPAQWSSKHQCVSPGATTSSKRSSMSCLPPEVLIHILKHIHSPRDIFNALRVSRTWCECSVELLWHKPTFPRFGTLQKMARLLATPGQTFTYASFIRRLNFLSLGSDLKDDIFSVFARCDRLERLTLVNCDQITGETLAGVLPCFPNLVAVDLSGVVETTDEAIIGLASSAKRLQGINLAGCVAVSDRGVMALARHCPLLRRVKLSGLDLLTDMPISALARSCPLLLEIDLNRCELITDISVRDIWTYSTHMREMRLSYCPELTDTAFPAPIRPEKVQADVPNPFPSSHTDAQDLPPLTLSRSFEHLRMLDLTGLPLVTDDAIEGIISRAPKIRNLVLSKCGLLSDRSVESICRLGRHLHYLHLGHVDKITDRSVRTLARSCTRLRYVDFANCVLLTDMSVFELSSLPKLRRVGLVRVNNLTDEAIYSLAERHATLERIHLSYCDQISVMAIHFLLQKLHKLTHLSLTGVPAFRQPELQKFCREPPKDFNSTQQSAFCVYSGKGVSQLRAFLTELFDHITEMNGTDDTEYEDDDDDVDAYQVDDTPEPEPEDGDEEEVEEFTPRRTFGNPITGDHHHSSAPASGAVPAHEFAFQRERPIRAVTVPFAASTGGRSISDVPSSVNIQGATSRLNAQIMAANPLTGLTRRPRGHGPGRIADILPIIESSNSPPPSDVASIRSAGTNHSNGAGFFHTYQQQEVITTGISPRSNGALTPDLNFAEIGHGRGAQGSSAQQQSWHTRDHASRHQQPLVEVDSTPPPSTEAETTLLPPYESPTLTPSESAQTLITPSPYLHNQQNKSPTGVGVNWPYREKVSPVPPSETMKESQESVQFALGVDARGRSVKRTFRNTLNVAEYYASSLLCGRSSNTSSDGSGRASGSGSGTSRIR